MTNPQLGSYDYIALDAIQPSPTNPRKHFDEAALQELAQSIAELGVTVPMLVRPGTQALKPYVVHSKGTFVRYAVVENDEFLQIGNVDWKLNKTGQRVKVFDEGTEEENEDAAQAWVAEANSKRAGYELVTGERRWRASKLAGRANVPATVRELSDAEVLEIQMVENLQRADLHPVEEAEGYRTLLATGASVEDVAKKAGKTAAHVHKMIKLLSITRETSRGMEW